MPRRRTISAGLALVLGALGACDPAVDQAPEPIAPVALRARGQAGRYTIAIEPEGGATPIGALHAWIVEIAGPAGEPADVRQLVFDGGMPQHGHGFETRPQVTAALGPGRFRVDGVRFHMAGAWTIRVDVAGPAGVDSASFAVEVAP